MGITKSVHKARLQLAEAVLKSIRQPSHQNVKVQPTLKGSKARSAMSKLQRDVEKDKRDTEFKKFTKNAKNIQGVKGTPYKGAINMMLRGSSRNRGRKQATIGKAAPE